MRVGFLVSSVSREAGGLFQSVRGLAKAVISEDVNSSVFGISDPNSALDMLDWQPASVRTFEPQFRAWGYSSQLVPGLITADLDILSTHGLWKYCSVASRRWHRQTARPHIVHPHGMLEPWALRNAKVKKRIAALLYENQHLRGAACLRALSEAEARSIRSYGLRNPICVIPNGVDLAEPVDSSMLDNQKPVFRIFAQGRKILLYLGRLHPKKNVANLIRAWKQTLDAHPQTRKEWVLAIAGWGQAGYECELKKLTSYYGLMGSVGFLGPLFGQEKDAAYRACDAFHQRRFLRLACRDAGENLLRGGLRRGCIRSGDRSKRGGWRPEHRDCWVARRSSKGKPGPRHHRDRKQRLLLATRSHHDQS